MFLEVKNLSKYYKRSDFWNLKQEVIKAVDDLSFNLNKGEILGVVGESGCGKSTLGRLILRLVEPSGGEVFFKGENLFKLNAQKIKEKRIEMQIVFQDPYTSLNPKMQIGEIILEPLFFHNKIKQNQKESKTRELLEMVGLNKDLSTRYPHELSGGQRQRIGIARALTLCPELIIADEPVSALDVSIQAQIVNLLQDLQEKLNLAYIFIAHDLCIVKHLSQRIMVMYKGKIVELTLSEDLYAHPLHPYTKCLLSAVYDPFSSCEISLKLKENSSDLTLYQGCSFYPRCLEAIDICMFKEPELICAGKEHYTACHLVKEGVK
ncbi:MAG: ATP-binding cassette domain-containing protein [Armatimonadetes bacterium]|nr:ATP-binding cassette domain-containing protein [Armatimonadota bacterium]